MTIGEKNRMNNTTANDQRLLLAVSFGTSFADTREKTIGAIERRLEERFPDCTVQRCFTSRMIRKKLLERDGLEIYSPEQAMRNAQEKGIRELIVQPLYLMHGFEHRRLMETVREAAPSFDKLAVGKPLLSDDTDFCTMADAVLRNLSAPEPDTAVVLMGHGNEKKKKSIPEDKKAENSSAGDIQDNAVFAGLQQSLRKAGADNYFVATVEGEPEIGDILPVIKERGFRKVILAPFMVVAGDHGKPYSAASGNGKRCRIFLQPTPRSVWRKCKSEHQNVPRQRMTRNTGPCACRKSCNRLVFETERNDL